MSQDAQSYGEAQMAKTTPGGYGCCAEGGAASRSLDGRRAAEQNLRTAATCLGLAVHQLKHMGRPASARAAERLQARVTALRLKIEDGAR